MGTVFLVEGARVKCSFPTVYVTNVFCVFTRQTWEQRRVFDGLFDYTFVRFIAFSVRTNGARVSRNDVVGTAELGVFRLVTGQTSSGRTYWRSNDDDCRVVQTNGTDRYIRRPWRFSARLITAYRNNNLSSSLVTRSRRFLTNFFQAYF